MSILELDGFSSADWRRSRRLALCLRWRILAWLLRIAWIRRRRLSIAYWWLVIIPWRRVLRHVLHGRHLCCRHEGLISWLRHNHCPLRRTMAVKRAARTTTASHDRNNDREEHDRADNGGGNNTSAPNRCISTRCISTARWQTIAITALFARATLVIVRTVITGFSADAIITTRLSRPCVAVTVISTVGSASDHKETAEEKANNFRLWRHASNLWDKNCSWVGMFGSGPNSSQSSVSPSRICISRSCTSRTRTSRIVKSRDKWRVKGIRTVNLFGYYEYEVEVFLSWLWIC